MTVIQLVGIQLLLIIISNQILASPIVSESTDAIMNGNQNFIPTHDYVYDVYDKLEQILSDIDNSENLRQHLVNKLSKRRAQAKANLAGLWGVPTRFA